MIYLFKELRDYLSMHLQKIIFSNRIIFSKFQQHSIVNRHNYKGFFLRSLTLSLNPILWEDEGDWTCYIELQDASLRKVIRLMPISIHTEKCVQVIQFLNFLSIKNFYELCGFMNSQFSVKSFYCYNLFHHFKSKFLLMLHICSEFLGISSVPSSPNSYHHCWLSWLSWLQR